MIVPMKKISLMMLSKDVDDALHKLGELGVLHIEYEKQPVSETIERLKEEKRLVDEVLPLLTSETGEKTFTSLELSSLVREILKLKEEKDLLVENIYHIEDEIERWSEWGDFAPHLIDELADKKIYVKLCKLTERELKNLPEDIVVEKISRKANILYCVIISRKEIQLDVEVLKLPEMGIGDMLARCRDYRRRIEEIDRLIQRYSLYKDALKSYKKKLDSLLIFNNVREGMGSFEAISYLKGYCPYNKVEMIEKLALKERWGIVVEDVDENDMPPTLIQNPRWIEIVRPVFKIINIIPGYREFDISLLFLLFFSIFFGILVGDAGYGIIFLLSSFILSKRFKGLKDKSIFFLLKILSLSAILWGIFTGTFFGQTDIIKPLLPSLGDIARFQTLCFFIGALQLSIAHIWKFLRKMPSLKALCDIGWLLLLWGSYFLARYLILGYIFPSLGKKLFLIGAFLIILFTNPVKDIFKTIGSGLGNFALKAVGGFTDVISYIRLFAVGVAGVTVSNAFNQMASGLWHINMFGPIGAVIVLLFGHSLNILLCILAILVHGVRLNVLEFSGHLDIEWSGIEYAPFKKEVI